MKTVFNSSEVPHIWAGQTQNEGRNSQGNFYFKGATIYSYGSHFPIATINGNDVLFTMRTYSHTTSKQVWETSRAISHKNIIYCYDVPTVYNNSTLMEDNKKGYFATTHENNLKRWKYEIKSLFNELGNKKIRNVQDRVNGINGHIAKLNAYCSYFSLPIKDKELKSLLKIAASEDFINQARQAKDKLNAANEIRMKQAAKAYEQYIDLWRKDDSEAIKELSPKIKDLCRFYDNHTGAYTRLRFNTGQNRVETSKGVQIPVEIAKRAFKQLTGCIEGVCKDIEVPVMQYTITETTKDCIKAGCHTIPKTDVKYIAQLLNW